jgi:Xaa-Pro aminopeptidase
VKSAELTVRIKSIQRGLNNHHIDALLVTNSFNVRYLSQFTGSNGQIFISKKKAYLITDFRYINVAKKILPNSIKLVEMKKGLINELQKLIKKEKTKTMGFEEKNINYSQYSVLKKQLKNFCSLKPTQGIIENLRMIKTSEELKLIIKAQRIAEKVFLEVRKNLKIGKTEEEIAWEIEKLGHEYGADAVSFPAIVGFEQNSATPHHQNSNRKLKKGDIILIDMGMMYKGYCSDMTRMIFTKKPTHQQEKIYNIILDAQKEAIKNIKANIKGNIADKWSRDIITKEGYGKTFGHSLGHSIGLEVHEAPSLSTGYEKPIPQGSIVTVEPGIYLENSFGVRIEDMVLVKRNHVVNLTKIPKNLQDSIFTIH